MRIAKRVLLLAAVLGVCLPGATAGVAVVVEKQHVMPNTNFFSVFGLDESGNIFTAGYSNNQQLRWCHILDDTTTPWTVESDVRLNWFQLQLYAVNGFAANTGSVNCWGMNYDSTTGKYFLEALASLRAPGGGPKLDAERDISIYDPRLPDSLNSIPTGVTLSNLGGVYRLMDTSKEPLDPSQPRAKFLSSGVQVGDRVTLYPVDTYAAVLSDTYTITAVISETELRLDRDPVWPGVTTATDVGYLLSLQPWVTLGTFRAMEPFYVANPTTSPLAEYKGGFNADHTRLYIGDARAGNLISVNTRVSEDFSIFVPYSALQDYVQEQHNLGRRRSVAQTLVFLDSFASRWSNASFDATVDPNTTTHAVQGSKSIAVTFNGAGGALGIQYTPDPNDPVLLDAAAFTKVRFSIHGGPSGGQAIDLRAQDATGVAGPTFSIAPPTANAWVEYEIPVNALGVSTIGGLQWLNGAAGAQPTFYVDFVSLKAALLLGVAEFDPNEGGVATAQVATDAAGRVWFSEGETDDLMWTDDGATLHTFLTSNEIQPVTHGFETSASSTGLQVMGLIVDPMGTVYWSDNGTRCIWKAPACGGAENIRQLASADEIKAALGITSSPSGMNCFSLRGLELLTFQYVSTAVIYKVDLNTFEFGDFSEDLDTDSEDLGLFVQALAGPEVTTPPAGCPALLFARANLDQQGNDVDLADFARMQRFATGPLP